MVLFIALGIILAPSFQEIFSLYYVIGKKLGTITAMLLTLTLLPGILKRLQWFQTIRTTLMVFRRHFGILMYWTAVAHGMGVFGLQAIVASNPVQPNLFIASGSIATFLCFPLLLTSNDIAVRIMKKWWNVLHKLVYLVLVFAAIHTLYTSFAIGFMLVILVIAEGVSYIYAYITHHSARR